MRFMYYFRYNNSGNSIPTDCIGKNTKTAVFGAFKALKTTVLLIFFFKPAVSDFTQV